MRALYLACAMLAAFPAHADLYRWVDPESGSVKFSSVPPPWYGDPVKQRRAPPVEVLRYGPAASPAAPAEVSEAAALGPGPIQQQRRALMQLIAAIERGDVEQGDEFMQRRLAAYREVSAELDRLDPQGAAARKAEESAMMEALRARLEGAAR